MRRFIYGASFFTCLSLQPCPAQQLIPCNTYEVQEYYFQHYPGLRAKAQQVQQALEADYQAALQQSAQHKTAATVYTVPVVFHVLHENGPENVSDQVIIDALDQINKDFAKTGNDIASIDPLFAPLYVDAEIRFMLAKRDPNGNCTNGIIRHYDANTLWDRNGQNGYSYSGTGPGRWPTDKYLNIYLVKCIYSPTSPCPATTQFIGGYAPFPGTAPTSAADAIVFRADQLFAINNIRAVSHEIGHWLNLFHTFGGGFNNTCGDDNVADTPPTMGILGSCPSSASGNTCSGNGTDNVQNFMNYSGCPRMFTQGQVTRMRSALTSAVSGRNNLWTANNLVATNVNGTDPCIPVANYTANKYRVCQGQPVIFTSQSAYGANGGNAWTFQGGNPSTSASTGSVSVVYAAAGSYSVSMTTTNTTGSHTRSDLAYIDVLPGATQGIPYSQAFEGGLPGDWLADNPNSGSVAWAPANAGATGTSKSMYINSVAGNAAGQIDVLETPVYNFNNVTNASLSYYYAYARKSATQNDTFKVQYSLDCGGTWNTVPGGADQMSTMASNTGGVSSSPFTPTAAQWSQKTVSNPAFSNAVNNKPAVKFRFYFRNDPSNADANNLYIDQVNMGGTVGIDELANEIGLSLYPNPTHNTATLAWTNPEGAQNIRVSVMDLLGRVLENTTLAADSNETHYTVNQNQLLSPGIYLVGLSIDGRYLTRKLIIQ